MGPCPVRTIGTDGSGPKKRHGQNPPYRRPPSIPRTDISEPKLKQQRGEATLNGTVHETRQIMHTSILVPTDGSDGSIMGAQTGLRLAAQFDASVHSVYVIDERVVLAEYDHAVEAAEREAETALDRVGRLGGDVGVPVEKHLRRGIPHEEILESIGEYSIDLVVIGTHGRSGLDRWVNLGSVTERVVRLAPVPVHTVPV